MDDDVLQQVLRFLHELGIEPDGPCPVVAAAPLGFHALEEVAGNRHAELPLSIGTQTIRGRIDYVLFHKHSPYSIIENKLRIFNDGELAMAVGQAKSYALQIGVEKFLVAAPEGYWFYTLMRNKETLVSHILSESAQASEELIAQHLLP